MPVKPDSKEVVSSIADPSYVMAAQELIAGQCPGESDAENPWSVDTAKRFYRFLFAPQIQKKGKLRNAIGYLFPLTEKEQVLISRCTVILSFSLKEFSF
ncbi:hypothetical protein RIR_jg30730.t1 [Rhizophagus irregularis DAOM 181602=DAOM 197198]|nr:hypothetical protein RIR_jg30730.t1 [Rhizophagus irregularis DAOM 181602=DAOM 197198]